jgi:argininosuccinate lyase
LYEASLRDTSLRDRASEKDIWKNLSDLSKGKGKSKGKSEESDVYVSLESKMKGQCMIDLSGL